MVWPGGRGGRVTIHHTEETLAITVACHGHPDPVYSALAESEYPVIYELDVRQRRQNPVERAGAGIVCDAGFSEEEFDYLGLLLLICHAKLLRDLLGMTITAASGCADDVIQADFCSTVSTLKRDG
jgi:hypothetical protein